MTSREIEALVQIVQNEMEPELGVRPSITVGGEDGSYDVELWYSSDDKEVMEAVASSLTDDELRDFLTYEIQECIRDFYYRMEHGSSVAQHAKVLLAEWIAEQGIIPSDVYVDVRFKDSRTVNRECICCDKGICCETIQEWFDPDKPLSNGRMDSDYFFYCNGIKEFFELCENDNGEDFEIINVHGWD